MFTLCQPVGLQCHWLQQQASQQQQQASQQVNLLITNVDCMRNKTASVAPDASRNDGLALSSRSPFQDFPRPLLCTCPGYRVQGLLLLSSDLQNRDFFGLFWFLCGSGAGCTLGIGDFFYPVADPKVTPKSERKQEQESKSITDEPWRFGSTNGNPVDHHPPPLQTAVLS